MVSVSGEGTVDNAWSARGDGDAFIGERGRVWTPAYPLAAFCGNDGLRRSVSHLLLLIALGSWCSGVHVYPIIIHNLKKRKNKKQNCFFRNYVTGMQPAGPTSSYPINGIGLNGMFQTYLSRHRKIPSSMPSSMPMHLRLSRMHTWLEGCIENTPKRSPI